MLISQVREELQVGDINTKGVDTKNHETECHQPEGRQIREAL